MASLMSFSTCAHARRVGPAKRDIAGKQSRTEQEENRRNGRERKKKAGDTREEQRSQRRTRSNGESEAAESGDGARTRPHLMRQKALILQWPHVVRWFPNLNDGPTPCVVPVCCVCCRRGGRRRRRHCRHDAARCASPAVGSHPHTLHSGLESAQPPTPTPTREKREKRTEQRERERPAFEKRLYPEPSEPCVDHRSEPIAT